MAKAILNEIRQSKLVHAFLLVIILLFPIQPFAINVTDAELKALVPEAVRCRDLVTLRYLLQEIKEQPAEACVMPLYRLLENHRCEEKDFDASLVDQEYIKKVARIRFGISGLDLYTYEFTPCNSRPQGISVIYRDQGGISAEINVLHPDFCCKAEQETLKLLLRHVRSFSLNLNTVFDAIMQNCWEPHKDLRRQVLRLFPRSAFNMLRRDESRLINYFWRLLHNYLPEADPFSIQPYYPRQLFDVLEYGVDYTQTGCTKTTVVRFLMGCFMPSDRTCAIIRELINSHDEDPLELLSLLDLFQGYWECEYIYEIREQLLKAFIEKKGDLNAITWKGEPLLNMLISTANNDFHYAGLWHLVSHGLVPVFSLPPLSLSNSEDDIYMRHMLQEVQRVQLRLFQHRPLCFMALKAIFRALDRPVSLESLSLPPEVFRFAFKSELARLRAKAKKYPQTITIHEQLPRLSITFVECSGQKEESEDKSQSE